MFKKLTIILLLLLTIYSAFGESIVAEDKSIPDIVEQTKKAVVCVIVETKEQNTNIQNGSGFILKENGVILTNYHVIKNGTEIYINMSDGTRIDELKVLGADHISDIAVLKVREEKLPYLLPTVETGNSNNLKVGETVLAFGSPFAHHLGSQLTVTQGIISARNRSIETNQTIYQEFIQTDAAINPGNSGGPLINKEGEVIGINTAMLAPAQGIGFSIPINKALEITNQLLENGKVVRPWVGLTLARVSPRLAREYGIDNYQGAYISYVKPGSPADKANLKKGDIILEFKNRLIYKPSELLKLIKNSHIGEKVKISINRKGQPKQIILKIEKQVTGLNN